MDNIWFQSALWMALALLAATGSLFVTISAALFEIVIGAIAGNTVGTNGFIAGLSTQTVPITTRHQSASFTLRAGRGHRSR